MKNIAVFASGSGSDMQSVIDAAERGEINGKVVYVIVNKTDAYAIERAKKHGIPYGIFTIKEYGNVENRDKAILSVLSEYNIDLIVLAGYLSILSTELIKKYERKIINIHPSLIPRHCGMGYYGIKVHESVINSGDKISGATVHYVDENADTGEIIEQITVEVQSDDTAETLQKKVLEKEHILLPRVVAGICNKEN